MRRSFSLSLRLLSIALLAGCASEGGVTGTGISTIVAGHVALPDGNAASGVIVAVDESLTSVDEGGNFELIGEFTGPTELHFSPPGRPEQVGTLQVSIPAGSTTVLEEVTVDLDAPQPSAVVSVVRHGSVTGRIQTVSCLSNTGVAIELPNRSFFSFQLSDAVVIRDQQGSSLDCADLQRGDRIEATGVQLSDGTRIASTIDLSERPAAPLDQFAVEFGGSVNDIHCDEHRMRVIVLTSADPFLTKVRARLGTELFCVDIDGPRPCECEEIMPLDIVQVRGTVSVDDPAAVVADSIYLFPGPAIVDAPVVVRKLSCGAGKIETEAFFATTSQVVIARFDAATTFRCEDQPCRCRDLRPDDIVRLVGSPTVADGRPFVDALSISR